MHYLASTKQIGKIGEPGKKGREMEMRIVRLEENLWHIRTDAGELKEPEQKELIKYLDEIKLPYLLADGCLCIDGGVTRDAVFELLEHFYDGRAEVLPF